jgi:hypothetical protein
MERVMTKAVWGSVLTAAAIVLLPSQALAQQTDSKTVTLSVTVNAKAKLTLSSLTPSFSDADPDVSPLLTAPAITIDVKSRTTASGSVTLTVLAGGDLVNAASDSIDITALTWTVSGTGFAAGTMDKSTAQSLGTWSGGGAVSGTQTYRLANSWSYKTGSYNASITYTLTAP